MNRLVRVSLVLIGLFCLAIPWRSATPLASAQEKIDQPEAAKKNSRRCKEPGDW